MDRPREQGSPTPIERKDTNEDDPQLKGGEEFYGEERAIARLTDQELYNLSVESLRLKSWTGFRILLIMIVQGCNQAGYGVDWSVISGINAFPAWHEYFGFGTEGTTYATLNALMNIGIICGSPFLAFSDVIGRRGINFTGNAFVVLASFLQCFAPSLPMFMAGRFLLGFGSGIMSSPQYIAEVAPVHLRGRMVGIFGACFQVGAMAMNGILLGLAGRTDNWSWKLPFLLEAIFPAIVCLTIYSLTPESPRFLVLRGKKEAAKKMIAQYHTITGEIDQPIVHAVVQQIEDSLEHETSSFRDFWDYRVFFTKAVRYRLLVLFLYSIFQSWNGGGIIAYYLVPALKTIGITEQHQQLGINFGLTATYFVFTTCGAFLVDIFKRRTLIFAGLISFIILQTCATITSWQYNVSPSSVTAGLTITWIFLFQVFSSLLIATMHNLYPVEILSVALRAKGMGLYGLIQGGAGAAQQYGISIGIEKLGYKIWCVFIIYNMVQLVLSYFIFPETFGLTLEEVDAVFETKDENPVKMSLIIQKAKAEKERLEREIRENNGAS